MIMFDMVYVECWICNQILLKICNLVSMQTSDGYVNDSICKQLVAFQQDNTGPNMARVYGVSALWWGFPLASQVPWSFLNWTCLGSARTSTPAQCWSAGSPRPVITATGEDTIVVWLSSALNLVLHPGPRGCHNLLTWDQQCTCTANSFIHLNWYCNHLQSSHIFFGQVQFHFISTTQSGCLTFLSVSLQFKLQKDTYTLYCFHN